MRELAILYLRFIVLRKNYGEIDCFDKLVDNSLIYNVGDILLMSTYYSGEDEREKNKKRS